MIRKTILFILQLKKRIEQDNIPALSSQLTYFILLSFFPFVMFLLSLLSFTPLSQTEVINSIGEIFPSESRGIILAILNEIARNQSNALLSITVIATIWSASRGVLAIIKALNIAYNLEETRSGVYIRLMSFFYTIIFAIIIIATFILLVFGNRLLELVDFYLILSPELINLAQILRYILSSIIIFIFFIILYNAIPNRKLSIIEVMPGALFSCLGWIFVSLFFSYYIDNFTNFSYTYGSLAGIIILLLWLYTSSNIIMIGGEINALLVELKEKNH